MNKKERLISAYPTVFHMAECSSWPNIREYGLLSTTALLDQFQKAGEDRLKIESQWRPSSISIDHPKFGKAVIRDQKPARPEWLEKVLEGVTPEQWYKFLNGKVFFWLTEQNLRNMLKVYAKSCHDVITVDTRLLLDRHMDQITLSRINSGFARYGQGKRNFATFQRIEGYPLGPKKNVPKELTVEYGVPDIADMVLSVNRWRGNQFLKGIYEK